MSFVLMVSVVAVFAAVVGLVALRRRRRPRPAQRADDLVAELESARAQLEADTVDIVSGIRFFRDGTVWVERATRSAIKPPTIVRDRARLLDLESMCGDDDRTSLAATARPTRGATVPPLPGCASREITFGVVTDRWIERLVVTSVDQQERLWAAAYRTRQPVEPAG